MAPDGRAFTASIELQKFRGSRRVYAYLRFKAGGRTLKLYAGEVPSKSRDESLRAAWKLVRSKGLMGAARERAAAQRVPASSG